MKNLSPFLFLLSLSCFSFSQNSITPLNIIVNATYTNIGVQWNVSGDVNYNSTLLIEYKKTSQLTYNLGAKTLRANPNAIVDGNPLKRIAYLRDRSRIMGVMQAGKFVAGPLSEG